MDSRGRSRTRSLSRSLSRSPTPRSRFSRSNSRHGRRDVRSPSRSQTPPPRRHRRRRSYSRSRSRSYSPSRSPSPNRSQDASKGPRDLSPASQAPGQSRRGTKIVVERLSKTINDRHLHEIFETFGPIRDLDLPINRAFGTNRGTAYILFEYEEDAQSAIAHMHEAQVDGVTINVSIVLPRRKLSPPPPVARRGANIDPRNAFTGPRGGGAPSGGFGQGVGRATGPRRHSPSNRYGSRRLQRGQSRSPSRSPEGASLSRGGGHRYRSRSYDSYSSRSRSRSRSPSRTSRHKAKHNSSGDYDTRRQDSSRPFEQDGRSRSYK